MEKTGWGGTNTYSHTLTDAGVYKVWAFVRDGNKVQAGQKYSGNVTVTAPLTISAVTAGGNTVGSPITWTATATGGTGTLQYYFKM